MISIFLWLFHDTIRIFLRNWSEFSKVFQQTAKITGWVEPLTVLQNANLKQKYSVHKFRNTLLYSDFYWMTVERRSDNHDSAVIGRQDTFLVPPSQIQRHSLVSKSAIILDPMISTPSEISTKLERG